MPVFILMNLQLHITQHKRFALRARPNPALFEDKRLGAVEGIMSRFPWDTVTSIIKKCWASFMLESLYAIGFAIYFGEGKFYYIVTLFP